MPRKIFAIALAGAISLTMATSALANEGIGGYAVVGEDVGVVYMQVSAPQGRQTVTFGQLRGTWLHGNMGFGFMTLFSQVTGNSGGAANTRAQGLGTAINGNGITTGRHDGWRQPGVASRSETARTIHGTNRAMWNLR